MTKTLIAALILCTVTVSYAQVPQPDPVKQKRYTHQAGVQINELLRQVFNFNGNAVNTNPYLFIYSINNVRTGWGLRTGIGYNYQSLTNDDGITRRSTDLNDLQARLGIEKMFQLSQKWGAGVGLDGVLNHNDDYTKSVVRSFDTVTTITTTKITSYGGGCMVWLRYHLTKRVLIGTESSFYYAKGQENSEIAITRRQQNGSGQLTTSFAKVDNERIEGKLSVPIAFFLVLKF